MAAYSRSDWYRPVKRRDCLSRDTACLLGSSKFEIYIVRSGVDARESEQQHKVIEHMFDLNRRSDE